MPVLPLFSGSSPHVLVKDLFTAAKNSESSFSRLCFAYLVLLSQIVISYFMNMHNAIAATCVV